MAGDPLRVSLRAFALSQGTFFFPSAALRVPLLRERYGIAVLPLAVRPRGAIA